MEKRWNDCQFWTTKSHYIWKRLLALWLYEKPSYSKETCWRLNALQRVVEENGVPQRLKQICSSNRGAVQGVNLHRDSFLSWNYESQSPPLLDSPSSATSNFVRSDNALISYFASLIIDSEANRHMTGSSQGLLNYYPHWNQDTVRIADGTFTLYLECFIVCAPHIKLSSVFHVPRLSVFLPKLLTIWKMHSSMEI